MNIERLNAKCYNRPMRQGPHKGQPVCYYTLTSPSTRKAIHAHNITHASPHAQAFPSCGEVERTMEFRAVSAIHSHIFYVSVICRMFQSNRNTHSVTLLRNGVLQTIVSRINSKNTLPSHLLDQSHQLTCEQVTGFSWTQFRNFHGKGLGTLMVPFPSSHHADGQI